MKSVSWTAHIKTIAVIIPKRFREAFQKLVQKSERFHNGFVTITISLPHKPRSTGYRSQNHHLNGHIQQIASETGNPSEVIKLEAKVRAVDMEYPMLIREDGSVQKDLWGRIMGISEADSSTEECAILIEATHMIASELGIILKETE